MSPPGSSVTCMISEVRDKTVAPDLVDAVVARCLSELGETATWLNPEGYPDGLALCIIDSIWSLGVRYESHVVPVLNRYRTMRREAGADPSKDGTRELLSVAHALGAVGGFADALKNHQRTSTKAGAPLKAEAIIQVARALLDAGIDSAGDFRRAIGENPKVIEELWRATPGQGSSDIGWRYVQLLAGADEVKPDRMINRFLSDSGASGLSPSESAALVRAAASRLNVPARVLDHAIWRHESARRRRRRKMVVR